MPDTEALASVITWLAGVVCSAKPEVAFPYGSGLRISAENRDA